MRGLWRQLAIATNWPVLASVVVLVTLGTLSIWADTRDAPDPVWPKHVVFVVIGVAGMAAFQAVNYQILGRWAWAFYTISLLLILYTVAGSVIGGPTPLPFVRRVNSTYAWLVFGGMSLQPAELMKISFVMVLARYLRHRSTYRTLQGLVMPFTLAGVPVLLILKQPDMGTALVFGPTLFAMLYVAGAKLRHLAGIVAVFVVVVAPLAWLAGPVEKGAPGLPVLKYLPAVVKGYHRERVYSLFRNDPGDRNDTGFQQERALMAMGSGGLTGKGLGEVPVGRRVPEAHNDMIFALIGEQFGWLGSAAVVASYVILFMAGLEIASSTREPFGKLVAVGIVTFLAAQTTINLLVVTRLMPVTGVPLSFVSYGGSSLLASFLSAGLLLNIGQNRPMVMARSAFEFG